MNVGPLKQDFAQPFQEAILLFDLDNIIMLFTLSYNRMTGLQSLSQACIALNKNSVQGTKTSSQFSFQYSKEFATQGKNN
jgi:hypothetical protein